MRCHIGTHELPQHLRRRPVLRLARRKKALPKLSLYPDTEAGILHDPGV